MGYLVDRGCSLLGIGRMGDEMKEPESSCNVSAMQNGATEL